MKFKVGDIIQGNRPQFIAGDVIREVVWIKQVEKETVYTLKRVDNGTFLELSVKFTDKNYNKI